TRRSARLQVPGVHVAGAAAHPEDDQALVLFPQRRRRGAESLQKLHSRQCQERKTRHVFEEMATMERGIITGVHGKLGSWKLRGVRMPQRLIFSVSPKSWVAVKYGSAPAK